MISNRKSFVIHSYFKDVEEEIIPIPDCDFQVKSLARPVEGLHISVTLTRILFRKDLINIIWSQPCHIVFVDISNKTYYLIAIESFRFNQVVFFKTKGNEK
jgi:hypothetical protein